MANLLVQHILRMVRVALRSRYLVLLRIATAACFVLFAWTLICALPHQNPSLVRAASPEPIAAGATLFHERGCEHCHGVDGRGGTLGPDLSTIGKRRTRPQIEHQIHDGGGGMPAFSEALQPDEITQLVEFLHMKQKAPKQKKGTLPSMAAPTGN